MGRRRARGVRLPWSGLDFVANQWDRLQRVYTRLAGPVDFKRRAYAGTGLLTGAGVGLASVVLFLLRAERVKRSRRG